MYSLQIALTDLKLAKSLASYSTKENLFKNTKVSTTGDTTLTTFISQRPDILIIDSTIASTDGYRIINLLPYLNLGKKFCKIYVFSNSPKNFTNTELVTSLKTPTTLKNFKNTLKKIYDTVNTPTSIVNLSKPHNQQDWKNLLYELSFSITNLGTTYLSYILEYLNNLNYAKINMNDIYEIIATNFKVSPIQAKGSINSTIKSSRKHLNIAKIYKVLPNYDGREITAKYLLLSLLEAYG